MPSRFPQTWSIPDKWSGYMTVGEHSEGVYIRVGRDHLNFYEAMLSLETALELGQLLVETSTAMMRKANA